MTRLLRINMRTESIVFEDLEEDYQGLGGRGLIAKILLNEVNPKTLPLSNENKLVVAAGLLAGTTASCTNRLSIGAKSPLTGGIKESNSGGIFALWLASNNIQAIVIEDIPKTTDKWKYICINPDECTLKDANEYKGMGTAEFCKVMMNEYPDAAIACIGPAGEKLYKIAGIAVTDMNKRPDRYCGRGGLGAVMGSKLLKGIVITNRGKMELNDPKAFREAQKTFTKILLDAPGTVSYRTYGTAALVNTINNMTALPTYNFAGVKFDKANEISGEKLRQVITERGGEGRTAHACMPGCVVQCSNVCVDKDGKYVTSGMEYETLALLGSNIGIGDLDQVVALNAICNDFGVDTIETGATLGIAMEAGVESFGDYNGVRRLFDELMAGTEFGALLGQGAVELAKALGVSHVPAINGQSMAAYDPRAIKIMGITYATSPMGADHTYGPGIKIKSDDPIEFVKRSQMLVSKVDCLGLCTFARAPLEFQMHLVVDLINAKFGWDKDVDWLDQIAKQTIRDEHRFNELAGFDKERYRMPSSFTDKKIESTGEVFDIPAEELDKLREHWSD